MDSKVMIYKDKKLVNTISNGDEETKKALTDFIINISNVKQKKSFDSVSNTLILTQYFTNVNTGGIGCYTYVTTIKLD